jgi:hypothetical protein
MLLAYSCSLVVSILDTETGDITFFRKANEASTGLHGVTSQKIVFFNIFFSKNIEHFIIFMDTKCPL